MTNYFIKLFHVVMISTQLGCVAANFDHPFDGASGLLTNQFLGQLAIITPTATATVSGKLVDSSGTAIANATLTVANSASVRETESVGRTVSTSTSTDSGGNWSLNLRVAVFTFAVTSSSGARLGTMTITVTGTTSATAVPAAGASFTVTGVTTAPFSSVPSNLSYPSSNLNLVVGTPLSQFNPTVTGTVTSYSVNPPLPNGLQINPSTGEITGAPIIFQSQILYTISASNSMGSSTFGILISVSPISLRYSINSLSMYVGKEITVLNPITNGIFLSYSVNPSLPEGINIDKNTGAISGTPTTAKSSASYTITASNSSGSITTYNLNITILISLTYNASNLNLIGGESFELIPIVKGGVITSYSIFELEYDNSGSQISAQPKSPEGIFIDTNSGVISGTPKFSQSTKRYNIKGNNSVKPVDFYLNISIKYKYQDNLNGTISQSGGLVWQKCHATQENSFLNCIGTPLRIRRDQAVIYCQNLQLGGRVWRLPSIDELRTLIEKDLSPLIDQSFFPNLPSIFNTTYFWSSTFANNGGLGGGSYYAGVFHNLSGNYFFGEAATIENNELYFVRCVSN